MSCFSPGGIYLGEGGGRVRDRTPPPAMAEPGAIMDAVRRALPVSSPAHLPNPDKAR